MEYNQRIKQIIDSYSEDFESDHSNPWVSNEINMRTEAEDIFSKLNEVMHEYAFNMQYLGFVEGVSFVLDVMSGTDDKNVRLIKQLINEK